MPLSTVFVSTVSSRPRAWSSHTNIRAKDVQGSSVMNSTEEISTYKEPNQNFYTPTITRRTLGYSYDFPEESPKKEKKWSIGSFFRRKKRDDSASSSEEEGQKRSFLGRRKRKQDKRKKPTKPVAFDHVVIHPSRNSVVFNEHDDPGILSDPTGGFSNYMGRALPKMPLATPEGTHRNLIKDSRESLEEVNSRVSSVGSNDSIARKSRREQAKARAEARRTTMKQNSSSDEDSQRSGSSIRMRSDESLTKCTRDSSASRKSRGARTERYMKRLSKDGENPYSYLRLSKSDAENSVINWKYSDDSNRSPSRSPILPVPNKDKNSVSSLNSQSSSFLGLSTIPPSHGSYNKYRVSNSTSNPSYKPPLSMNEYNNSTKRNDIVNTNSPQNVYFNNQRSISCDANIHKAPSSEFGPEVMHVQFPISRPNARYRNLSLIDASQFNKAHGYRHPPPPPPRDPRRLATTNSFENSRPNTYYFDSASQMRSQSFNVPSNAPQLQKPKFGSFNLYPSYKSISEDYLVKEPIQLSVRPSSTTPETQRFVTRRSQVLENPESFNYLTDKKPRSRKPIFIQNQNLGDSSGTKKAADFWKQKESEGIKNSRTSPQMFTSQSHVQTKVFLPSVLQNDMNSNSSFLANRNTSSPFKPVSPVSTIVSTSSQEQIPSPSYNTKVFSVKSPPPLSSPQMVKKEIGKLTTSAVDEVDSKDEVKRKSANLEEALDELEAIYNSLRLGDEDLLERAEQRERDAAAQKLMESKIEPYPSWGVPRGALSDSSFSYEPFDSLDSPRRKRVIKKSHTIDRKTDDMAYRKINKDRAATINDPQSFISKLSYMQTSPVYNNNLEDGGEDHKGEGDEPDVTFDDVVYRNVKHAKNSLKIVEPQPPFGIPLGPITPAANSDYLHAIPDNIHRPVFKPRKIPDIVKDDLAFRNLRKDSVKDPVLPPLSPDDLKNNNGPVDLNSLKKKRAVRSLSANIGSLIQKDVIEKALKKEKTRNNVNNAEFKTLTAIADAMEIARQVLKEKDNKITATKKAFMSDTDTNNYSKLTNHQSLSTQALTESRLNFLNKLRGPMPEEDKKISNGSRLGDDFLDSKPPRGLTPDRRPSKSPAKESTPTPTNTAIDSKLNSQNSSLDDLLTALAEEAKQTTERITNELKLLGEEKQKRTNVKEEIDKIKNTSATTQSNMLENEKQKETKDKSENVGIDNKLSEIDAVSEHAKLCEKLLEYVVDSTELMASAKPPPEEEVEQIKQPMSVKSVANVILTREGSKEPKEERGSSSSEHDYENLISDKELKENEDVTPGVEEELEKTKCVSPFEEHKAELIASFQELKENIEEMEGSFVKASKTEEKSEKSSSPEIPKKTFSVEIEINPVYDDADNDGVTGKPSTRRSRSRLPRWLRGNSCGKDPDTPAASTMSDQQESRAERMARYKEERRKQLAAQFGSRNESSVTTKRNSKDGSNSSSSDGPRQTRASKLRAAAAATAAQENTSSQNQGSKVLDQSFEKAPACLITGANEPRTPGSRRLERDKSSKRKSNLNRSLNSEEVPSPEFADDSKARRRRRRFFTPDILEQTQKDSSDDKTKGDNSFTASFQPQPSTSPITASPTTSSKLANKKSELSIHMENARRGVTPSFSEMGRHKPSLARRAITSSPKEKTTSRFNNNSVDQAVVQSDKEINKENIKRRSLELDSKFKVKACSDDDYRVTRSISRRMEELTAYTKETLAKVERLSSKAKESPRKDLRGPLTSSPIKNIETVRLTTRLPTNKLDTRSQTIEKHPQQSILKKKSSDESTEPVPVVQPVATAGPVSILKRKVSTDEHNKSDSAHSSNHTPPVTFSPNVVEPTPTNRKQGILKKRRSLDESQVMRHRSCSPDVAAKADSRSILKNQRRSSLEELTRTQSPEPHLQSILKRKTSKTDEDDHSLNSPQSILKRRSGASSAGSTGSSPHVSITTAVILAAAGGAEMVLEPENEPVRPILKKKSFSDEHSNSESSADAPKPILKKKSSTDTDDCEDKPMKPILKPPRSSLDKEVFDTGQESRSFSSYKHPSSGEAECDVKPILKLNTSREDIPRSREDAPRPRLSFSGDKGGSTEVVYRQRTSRRSHTICTDFNFDTSPTDVKEEDRMLRKPRPLSVSELVMSFEQNVSTGAIPKRSSLKRQSDRYRTQPVTPNEVEESLNFVRIPQLDQLVLPSSPAKLNALSSPATPLTTSSNSRFNDDHHGYSAQSLLDFTSSLENDSHLNSFLTSSLLHQTTSPDNGVCGKMSSDSAFQSLGDGLELDQDDQPSSQEETVKEKMKLEPSKLAMQMKNIAEEAKKLKLSRGNAGIQRYQNRKGASPGEGVGSSRFSTQPVTFEEVQEASRINKSGITDDSADEINTERSPSPYGRRGILKSKQDYIRRTPSPGLPKSALKKRNSFGDSPNRRPILKIETADFTHDEGISSNDSGSDSDKSHGAKESESVSVRGDRSDYKRRSSPGRVRSGGDTTSDGESSGGREVRSIFKSDEGRLRVKQTLESVLSKSRSQGRVAGDDSTVTTRSPQQKNTSIRRSQTHSGMPRTIADLQAKLQERGQSEWRKRVQYNNNASDELKLLKEKNRYNDELSEKSSILDAKKTELDASLDQWKARVEKSDAEKFTVSGRMEKVKSPLINIPIANEKRKTPQAKRFKGKEVSESSSTPVSPEKNTLFDLSRSRSVADPSLLAATVDNDSSGSDSSSKAAGKRVSVTRPDDDTFNVFYKSVEVTQTTESVELSIDDLDAVQRGSMLVQKKNVQVQKRRGVSRNPIKALASRTDISNEYTEVITGVAEREKKRLNIEKLAKNSNKAIEALAGLASNEDFKSIALKKKSFATDLYPYKDLMLLQIKGRRHVQTRLVQPVASSINEGDCYLLITPTELYSYAGAYSNVIEQSRLGDVSNHIQKTGDMGCKVSKVFTVNSKPGDSKHTLKFWKLLGAEGVPEIVDAGHPDEDESYESNILGTNMIYVLENDELVPFDKYWGSMPKIEMLQETAIIVFDFGSEMYVWSGKNAPLDKKRVALKLAKEMWDEGYNYSECNVCPLNVASVLGDRNLAEVPLKAETRPDWAMFAKITQHRETVLFKEKFLDWPDFSRVIRVKSDENIKMVNPSYDIRPCDVEEMLKEKEKEPDLVVEGIHLGRGDKYFDEETRRLFDYDTLDIKGYKVLENTYEELSEKSLGHFYDGDSYIYNWRFRMTVRGRELNGNPSKHAQVGRDKAIFFYWQGCHSSVNEKAASAFLTVELDRQNAPQVRVVQGSEPAAFLHLFDGTMVIHNGKRDEINDVSKPRLFIIRGEVENEIYMMEIPCGIKQLRSRSSFVIVNPEDQEIIVWHGSKSSRQKKKVVNNMVQKLLKEQPVELNVDEEFDVETMEEGEESLEFFELLGKDRSSYVSLVDSDVKYDHTIRLFHMSSITGTFTATELLCPHRSEHSSPYPFVQSELYSASQPALFLIDNHHELWLWQGWWPEKEVEIELSDQTGSGAMRWQAERRAAMQTAINYWKKKNGQDEAVIAYLVWAGLEPLAFKNLFPAWTEMEDVAELNIKEGRKPGAKLPLERELALLSRTIYPLAEILHRPLPEGVDPTQLEIYLSPEDFQELLSMTKEEFQKLPSWRQTSLKKEKGLF